MPSPAASWRPSAARSVIALRADLLARTRRFFDERGVLEVETPLLGAHGVTDPNLHSLTTAVTGASGHRRLYLQTSPELAMKRLLAAGCGSIYQICKAFRDQEHGRRHQPEFTMLEWYRIGFDHNDLMDEIDELLARLVGAEPAERISYRQAFVRWCDVDPSTATLSELLAAADDPPDSLDRRDDVLSLLMTQKVEPRLGRERPTFLYDFPASQAALARIRLDADGPADGLAERFELYIEGTELANGFRELTDAHEQQRRFERDLELRRELGLDLPEIDEAFLDALADGLPECAGVALGFDRLLMVAAGAGSIDEVLAFPVRDR